MVCTSDTGIIDVALVLSRWPPIWNSAMGSVVRMTSRDGLRSGYLRAGMICFSCGKAAASVDQIRQYEATKTNWTMVSVAGLGKLLRMDLDDVFVSSEVVHQMMQRAWRR